MFDQLAKKVALPDPEAMPAAIAQVKAEHLPQLGRHHSGGIRA
jgi:hypothetical protein